MLYRCRNAGASSHIYGIRTSKERVVGGGHSATLRVYLEGRFELESAQQLDAESQDQEPAQSLSRVRLFMTPQAAAGQAFLSFTVTQSLLKLMPIESVMPSKHLMFFGGPAGMLPAPGSQEELPGHGPQECYVQCSPHPLRTELRPMWTAETSSVRWL